MPRQQDFDALLRQEQAFLASDFLSPVLAGRPIRVRVAGVVLEMTVVRPRNFAGWGVFRPLDAKSARLVRAPSLAERQQYLELFPALRLVLAKQQGAYWWGLPAQAADARYRVAGLVPVALAQEVQLFDVVRTRWDGATCWFEGPEPQTDPQVAQTLRDALSAQEEAPAPPGSSPAQRDAYQHALVARLLAEAEARRDRHQERLQAALRRAGATLHSYREREDTYTVEYQVGLERHTSVVGKDRLEVRSAGICLSGGDALFDLQSLVHVIREGQQEHRIVHVPLRGENR